KDAHSHIRERGRRKRGEGLLLERVGLMGPRICRGSDRYVRFTVGVLEMGTVKYTHRSPLCRWLDDEGQLDLVERSGRRTCDEIPSAWRWWQKTNQIGAVAVIEPPDR